MLNVTAADANNDIQRTRFAPRAADASGLWLIPMQTRRRSSFVQDFVAAWTKVMNLDRFDLAR
jgi:hypothetical protein